MSPEHRSFLTVQQGVVAFVVNVILNGVIAWLIFRGVEQVPVLGGSGVAADLMITAFLLPFLTCMIVSRVVASQVRGGKVPRAEQGQLAVASASRGWWQRSIFQRSLFLGAIGILFAALPVVAALLLTKAPGFSSMDLVAFKALWAGLLACSVSPAIAWWAILSASEEASPARAA